MPLRRHFAYRIVSTLGCLLLASAAEAAPPEGKPVLVPIWKKTTVGAPTAERFDSSSLESSQKWASGWYLKVLKDCHELNRPTIPSAVPVVAGDFVVYTTDISVGCTVLCKAKYVDRDLNPGELAWHSDLTGSLIWAGKEMGPRTKLEDWLRSLKPEDRCNALVHRTLSTALSSSDGLVYGLDQLAVGVPHMEMAGFYFLPLHFPQRFNQVQIWELASGLLKFKLPELPSNATIENTPKNYAMSAPFPNAKRLFWLNEEDEYLRVRSFEWQKYQELGADRKPDREKLSTVWETSLLKPPTSAAKDIHRRIHAIHLVLANDLVVCPTHLGRVVAVEEKTGKIKWTHEYAPLDAKRFPTFAPEWVVVPPVVVGDRYIYAPADFPELLCLNVADGKKVWSVKKGDGLYPAVVGEQVLVIGEKTLRSLSLKDGSEQWKIDLPGLPCGRGAMLGDTYLLPISEPKTWRGMIAIVDLKTQKTREVLKPDKDEPIGNLVVHQDMLISQTLTEIAVYPIRK